MFQFAELPRPVIRHLNGLWRRRWLAIAVVWFLALAGWFALWLLPDKYESRAQVFVQTETSYEPVINNAGARPDFTQRVEVMRLQLLTRPNVEEIILRAGLDETIKARREIDRRAKMESMINWVATEIKIVSPRDMYFVITYKNSDSAISQAVVDAVVNLLIEQDLGASLSEREAARRRLDLQIESFEEKLVANERAVANFKRAHAAELSMGQGTLRRREQKESELVRVSDELERTKGRVLTLQNLLSATARTTSGDELDKLKVELADLRSRYQESHPDIRGVIARIEQLEEGAGGQLSSNPEYLRLSSELRVARDSIRTLADRETRLQTELEELDFAVGQAPAAVAELQQIERQYETTKKTYEELLASRDRLELTKNLGGAGRGVEYQVFEWPKTSLLPSDPPRLLLILIVLAVAGAGGVGAAVLLTMLDKSYTHSEELLDAFGLPILGSLSEVRSDAILGARRKDYKRLGGAIAVLTAVGVLYSYFTVFQLPVGLETSERAASVEFDKGAS